MDYNMEISSAQILISRLLDFARSHDKTVYATLKRPATLQVLIINEMHGK